MPLAAVGWWFSSTRSDPVPSAPGHQRPQDIQRTVRDLAGSARYPLPSGPHSSSVSSLLHAALLPVLCSPPSFSQTHISPAPHLPSPHHIPRPPHPFHCPHPLKRLYLFAYHLSLTWNSVHHVLGFYSSVSSWEFQFYEGRQSSFIPFILSGIWEVLKMSD